MYSLKQYYEHWGDNCKTDTIAIFLIHVFGNVVECLFVLAS